MPLFSDRNGYIIFLSFENQKFDQHELDGSSNLRDIVLDHASVVRCNMVSQSPLNYLYPISLLTGILGGGSAFACLGPFSKIHEHGCPICLFY